MYIINYVVISDLTMSFYSKFCKNPHILQISKS